jgi:hypothetical protein
MRRCERGSAVANSTLSALHAGLDHHLLVVARGTLGSSPVELDAETEGGGDLFDLLFPRCREV